MTDGLEGSSRPNPFQANATFEDEVGLVWLLIFNRSLRRVSAHKTYESALCDAFVLLSHAARSRDEDNHDGCIPADRSIFGIAMQFKTHIALGDTWSISLRTFAFVGRKGILVMFDKRAWQRRLVCLIPMAWFLHLLPGASAISTHTFTVREEQLHTRGQNLTGQHPRDWDQVVQWGMTPMDEAPAAIEAMDAAHDLQIPWMAGNTPAVITKDGGVRQLTTPWMKALKVERKQRRGIVDPSSSAHLAAGPSSPSPPSAPEEMGAGVSCADAMEDYAHMSDDEDDDEDVADHPFLEEGPEYWRHRVNEYHGVLWLSDLGHRVRLFEVRFYHRGFHTVDIVMRFIDGFGRWLDVLVQVKTSNIMQGQTGTLDYFFVYRFSHHCTLADGTMVEIKYKFHDFQLGVQLVYRPAGPHEAHPTYILIVLPRHLLVKHGFMSPASASSQRSPVTVPAIHVRTGDGELIDDHRIHHFCHLSPLLRHRMGLQDVEPGISIAHQEEMLEVLDCTIDYEHPQILKLPHCLFDVIEARVNGRRALEQRPLLITRVWVEAAAEDGFLRGALGWLASVYGAATVKLWILARLDTAQASTQQTEHHAQQLWDLYQAALQRQGR